MKPMTGCRAGAAAAMFCTLVVTALCYGQQSAGSDAVHRRGGLEALRGDVVRFDDSGITIRSALGAVHEVPWDRVRHVETAQPLPGIEEYLERAERLWRARSRLERGDAQLAEPLFEELFDIYRGHTHETALVVAEGLTICRLRRGALDLAVIPAMETLRLRRAGVDTVCYTMLERTVDDRVWLTPFLPPVWEQSPSLPGLIGELERYSAGDDGHVNALAALFRASAMASVGHDVSIADLERMLVQAGASRPASDNASRRGVALLRLVVELQIDVSDDDVERRLSQTQWQTGDWREAWIRFARGRALLADVHDDARMEGLVDLAHLPARFSTVQPYLSGLALKELYKAANEKGWEVAAESLREELEMVPGLHPSRRSLSRSGGGK